MNINLPSLKKMWIVRHGNYLKGKLKAKIRNFFQTFFGKPNISKVKFAELFLLLSVIFCKKIKFEVGLFPLFSAFSLWAQKLNQ